MKLSPNEVQAILLAVFAILVVTYAVIQHRHDSKETIVASIREEVLMLFLYAEKQDWVNDEKMAWVVHAFYEKFPEVIQLIIKETTIEAYLDKLYVEFKQYLVDGNIKDIKLLEIPTTEQQ